jgi:hypothetical protein
MIRTAIALTVLIAALAVIPQADGQGHIEPSPPPKVNTFIALTQMRAERFLHRRQRVYGDRIYGPEEDAVYWTDLEIEDEHNARITWHVLTHRGDLTTDWMSRCILTMKQPVLGVVNWPPTGATIKCRSWRTGWSG